MTLLNTLFSEFTPYTILLLITETHSHQEKVNQLAEQYGIHWSYHVSYFIILSSTWETKSCDSKVVFIP